MTFARQVSSGPSHSFIVSLVEKFALAKQKGSVILNKTFQDFVLTGRKGRLPGTQGENYNLEAEQEEQEEEDDKDKKRRRRMISEEGVKEEKEEKEKKEEKGKMKS